MKAGPRKCEGPKFISPRNFDNVNGEILMEGDADEQREEGEPVGETCQRLALEKEGAVVKRTADLKVPCGKKVEEH